MHKLKTEEIIECLKLEKHPEGGYYREMYRSDEEIQQNCLPGRFSGSRTFSTSIYFMLTDKDTSAFHRIKADEIWHFYFGQPLSIYQIDKTGELKIHQLGLDVLNGEAPQIIIEKETYFGAKVSSTGFSLVGCTVAPGFDFQDFEMPQKKELIKKYPQHTAVIEMLS